MSGRLWRRAGREDIPALSAFLAAREESCVGFTGRLLRAAPGAESGASRELRLPSTFRGGVWIAEETPEGSGAAAAPRIAGALLCHPSGLAFPVFPPLRTEPRTTPDAAAADDEGLRRALGLLRTALVWRASSAAGSARDVERFEAVSRLEPLVKVEYLSMSLSAEATASFAQRIFDGARRGSALSVRRATAADLDALFPLQEAYEREEVLTSIHEFNPEACRAALARSLELQMIFVAEEPGPGGATRIVAKAGTNARGFRVDQIGGVYTVPERRGEGAAAALMAALLRRIGGSGRAASLFVKPTNAAAIALYRGLGFSEIGGYRADYFLER